MKFASRTLLVFITTLLLVFNANADQPAAGTAAPGFELRDQGGDVHSLEDYRDQWVVLYFYPKDDTPGCTTEACTLRDDIFSFRELNCQVLGVSTDDVESHAEFAKKYSLPFPILADSDGDTSEAYGVKSRMFGLLVAKRQTFIIDPKGKIAMHYSEVDPATHSAQLLEDLRRLQSVSTVLPST